jgi:hypothetical protein
MGNRPEAKYERYKKEEEDEEEKGKMVTYFSY